MESKLTYGCSEHQAQTSPARVLRGEVSDLIIVTNQKINGVVS